MADKLAPPKVKISYKELKVILSGKGLEVSIEGKPIIILTADRNEIMREAYNRLDAHAHCTPDHCVDDHAGPLMGESVVDTILDRVQHSGKETIH